MIFPAGSTFVFGSWIYVANNHGDLHGHLDEILAHQDTLTASAATLDQLADKFSQISISDST